MKKLFTERKWKLRQWRINRDKLRRKRKKKRRIKVLKPRSVKTYYSPASKYEKKREKYEVLQAPADFSIINNTEEIVKYFESARDLLRRGHNVDFDLSKIQNFTPDAIALLAAIVEDRREHPNSRKKGNCPINPDLKQLFIESGFYNYVASKIPAKPLQGRLLLHKISNNKVEPELAKNVCIKGVKHSFNSEEKFKPLYEILIECMANTNNHASLQKRGEYDWWIYVYNNTEIGTTQYTFLDIGVGVFKSLPVKNYISKLESLVKSKSNVDLVQDLFDGKISSRTEQSERGRGFPLIFNHSKNPRIKNLMIITNDVMANLKTEHYINMSADFKGTLIYIEI